MSPRTSCIEKLEFSSPENAYGLETSFVTNFEFMYRSALPPVQLTVAAELMEETIGALNVFSAAIRLASSTALSAARIPAPVKNC